MKYSVWNQGTGLFDYYESSRAQTQMNTEKPRHLRATQALGASAERAAWPLPSNARKIGSGPHAIGRVASRARSGARGGLGDADPSGFLLEYVALPALIGVLFWRYVLHPKNKRSYR